MTEIPEDVMKAAIAAYERPIVEDGSSLVSLVNRMVEDEVKLCIARAILAERERCEKRNRRGPCEHVWVGKPGPKIFGFREFNCIKCGLGKQES